MSENVSIEFVLKQRVYIVELETYGVVVGIYLNNNGDQYQVRYFYDGSAKSVYFYPWELREKK